MERVFETLRMTNEVIRQALDELEPIVFPQIPAIEVTTRHELFLEGKWRHVVTVEKGQSVVVLTVGVTWVGEPHELVIAKVAM